MILLADKTPAQKGSPNVVELGNLLDAVLYSVPLLFIVVNIEETRITSSHMYPFKADAYFMKLP